MVREQNIGADLLHHESKADGYRGSTAIGASVENIVTFSKAEGDTDRRRRRLHNTACRFEQEAEDRWLRIEADRDRGLLLIDECEPFQPFSATGTRDTVAGQLLQAIGGTPVSWTTWARTADVDPKHGTARRARDDLAEQGLVKQTGNRWTGIEGGSHVA
jgi:hypothetical protein